MSDSPKNERRGTAYDAVRRFLAVTFLLYGAVKLADIQFNPRHQPYLFAPAAADDLTGFQLVWRFFGYSRTYQCFAGLAEVTAALLLLFARTARLGAFVFLPVIVNVVAVDVCYGVSTDATVVALALLAGDLFLLFTDRGPILAAAATLLRPPGSGPRGWRALPGWVLAIALLVLVFAVSTAAQTLRGH